MPISFNRISVALARLLLTLAAVLQCVHDTAADEFELTLLSGETRRAGIKSISESGIVKLGKEDIPLEDLRSIDRVLPGSGARGKAIKVLLCGDGQLFAESVRIVDEVCEISGHGLGNAPIRVPIDLVNGICFKPDELPDSLANSFGQERDEDQLVLKLDDSLESLNGLVEKLDENEITFLWNEDARTIPTKNLIAIAVASAGELSQPQCMIRFTSGATVSGQNMALENNELIVSVTGDTLVSFDWNKVQRVAIRSDRLQLLSDIDPLVFEHTPIVTSKREWKKDRSVSGNELKLGNRVYASGIGVASNSRLEYQLSGDFSRFCATIGIDAETDGRGECVFVVRGDGKELSRTAMSGSSEPLKLELDIQGIRKLELIVEPGADLDLADHANWCDACLLRK
ncbi:MAG: NPCBM/NEW2 domain-containing protein [Planctomycetota bacterium]